MCGLEVGGVVGRWGIEVRGREKGGGKGREEMGRGGRGGEGRERGGGRWEEMRKGEGLGNEHRGKREGVC